MQNDRGGWRRLEIHDLQTFSIEIKRNRRENIFRYPFVLVVIRCNEVGVSLANNRQNLYVSPRFYKLGHALAMKVGKISAHDPEEIFVYAQLNNRSAVFPSVFVDAVKEALQAFLS